MHGFNGMGLGMGWGWIIDLFIMAQMQGFLGEKILINGKANHQMDVKNLN